MKPSAIDLAALRRVVLSEGMDLDALQASPGYLPLAAAYLARAVPALVWLSDDHGGLVCICGAFKLAIYDRGLLGPMWSIRLPYIQVDIGSRPTPEECLSACETAFLRLVGVQP